MINRLRSWLIPSIADVLFLSVFLYLALPTGNDFLGDGDTGYHIRAGEYILNTLSIPKVDMFSFITPAIPWTAHEWLSEVVMAFVHKMGGLTSVVLVFALMVATSVRIFFRHVSSEGNNILLSVAASIAFVALANVHWLARPHIFSLLILLVWYRLLDDFQYRNDNRLWLLPLIMMLWVNLHGGFIIGIALLGIYWLGNLLVYYFDKEKWTVGGKTKVMGLGRVLFLTVLATLANPIGYHIFMFPFNLVSNKYIMDHTNEFLSPNFHEFQPFKYLLLLSIIIFAFAKRRPNLIEAALCVLLTSMSLYSVRYIPLFGVVVVPILLRYIEPNCLSSFPRVEKFLRQRLENIALVDSAAKGYFWLALGGGIVVILVMSGTIIHSFNPEKKPLAAIEFLKENPVAGNMFNNDEFGDLVIYSSHQQYKVFIDGRLDMYGTERIKEYNKILAFEPGWEEIVDKYGINWIFFDTNSALSRFLVQNENWKLVYSDKVASIFVKNIALHKPLIERFPDLKLANSGKSIVSGTL